MTLVTALFLMKSAPAKWQSAMLVHLHAGGTRMLSAPTNGHRVGDIAAVLKSGTRVFTEEAVQRDEKAFSAAEWHRQRRRQILADHSEEVRALTSESDAWVASLGVVILPCFAWVVDHAPEMSPAEWLLHLFGIGSLRANWAVYCGHAISHGRWREQVGAFGSARYNLALAAANIGHCFQVLPSYWLLHHSHHTKLGTLPLVEARDRAKRGRQTDGDLGIATRLFSPPSHKYALVRDREGNVLRRQSEALHQALNLVVHALAPVSFAGYAYAALRTGGDAEATLRRSLAIQASASLAGYLAVAAVSLEQSSIAPLAFYLASSALWLTPLNINWVWTSPHICHNDSKQQLQPTVSFYTPPNLAGKLLDVYMGFENYHLEHHDFPEMPMYNLPKLRRIAPEYYDTLVSMPIDQPETWRKLLEDDFFYACQDATLLGARKPPRVRRMDGEEAATNPLAEFDC